MSVRLLVCCLALAAVGGLWSQLPARGDGPQPWERGRVAFLDRSGMARTVNAAAARWNASGAAVRFVQAAREEDADVVVEVDDAALVRTCGRDCLGYSTSIGRPADRPARILLSGELAGDPRSLSVWVAAHELGHVLGLRHTGGRGCSVMSAHAFDTSCAPSMAARQPTLQELACVPAPADVRAAAALYGGRPARGRISCP